jgi:prepilin-type N-terminal cleavage/methylation domain-containing protein
MATRRPLRRDAGFSFIEILIVMGIIAILSGLVVVAIGIMTRKKPEIETTTRIQKLVGAVNDLKMKFGGMYPPMSLTAIEAVAGGGASIKKVPNHTNEGIEALYQSIYWPGVGLDPQFSDADLGNTDEDELDKAVGRGKALSEVIDGWGNPIIYIPSTEYATVWQNPVLYVQGEQKGGEEVQVRPWKIEGQGYENPTSFQVFSMGPDGQPNTEDDIKGW